MADAPPSKTTGKTVDPEYFRTLYRREDDPWGFASSPYEHAKYAATLAALPAAAYRSALELGCSIGVFTALLAPRCERLLAVDVSEDALERARRRCAPFPHVAFSAVDLSRDFPHGRYDLVTFCELGFYFSPSDLARIRDEIIASLEPNGSLVLVHWTPLVEGHAVGADAVHELFIGTKELARHASARAATYRLEAFVRR